MLNTFVKVRLQEAFEDGMTAELVWTAKSERDGFLKKRRPMKRQRGYRMQEKIHHGDGCAQCMIDSGHAGSDGVFLWVDGFLQELGPASASTCFLFLIFG